MRNMPWEWYPDHMDFFLDSEKILSPSDVSDYEHCVHERSRTGLVVRVRVYRKR
jgi:hypothetical protein